MKAYHVVVPAMLFPALIALMCVAAAGCSSKNGKTVDAACACGEACDQGNNLGVGKYCTKGGGQCDKNPTYIFCTVDYDSTAPQAFCTGPCGSDADCGSDAYCDGSGSSGPKGCVPASCGGTPGG